MKIISDTSVIISVITSEKTKEVLINKTQGDELYAPMSLAWEIGNAISAMYKRKSITEHDGNYIISAFKKIPISLVDINIFKAIQLAYKYNIYAYDAYMMQCAKEQKAALITLDKKLITIAKKCHINTIEV